MVNNGILDASTIEPWVGHSFPSGNVFETSFLRKLPGGDAMKLKEAIALMIMFATFIIALLSYIAAVYQAK